MNILKFLNAKTTWTNSELVLVKICIAAAYLMIGAYFSPFITHYIPYLGLLFILTGILGMYSWIKKMKAKKA